MVHPLCHTGASRRSVEMLPGIQLHLSGREVLSQEVVPIVNNAAATFRKKPAYGTGLWTSSWREETQDSDWVEWCRNNEFGEPDKQSWYLLTPAIDARLYVVDSHVALVQLLKRFPLEHPLFKEMRAVGIRDEHLIGIDFEQLAQEYDGVHLTYEAAGSLHLSYPLDMNSWDCESTVWFRWVFTSVEQIEAQKCMEVDG